MIKITGITKPKKCMTCGKEFDSLYSNCKECLDKVDTMQEDMPDGYKDGVIVSAHKLADAVDSEIMKKILGGQI